MLHSSSALFSFSSLFCCCPPKTSRSKHDLSSPHTGAIEPLVLSRTGEQIISMAHSLPKSKQIHRASQYHIN